ncbi:MAG: endonuclease III domain-containing protein [Syntrophomonadaceae bacterium]|nr:endonuclease III domain-containing protein [Syntrophomonadaceae bacterium]MDD4562248.1 endonuclease III domain-containing protein [Syntrophomonadaceae bacterium]
MQSTQETLMQIYQTLLEHLGSRGWWPADSRLEVIIGAVLTQAVAWKNVTRAINNLKSAHLININAILNINEEDLAQCIKPALYHRQKARKLKALMTFIAREYNSDLDLMFAQPLPVLREKLLAVWGIGPETADSILLYAGDKPVFVVDTYTKRIFYRLGMVDENISYQEMQEYFHNNVPPNLYIYNEYHALLVGLGANYCKKSRPGCSQCPLLKLCKYLTHLQEKY